jgi:hypothetical protein
VNSLQACAPRNTRTIFDELLNNNVCGTN